MAVRGIVDSEAYVVEGYQTPVDYFFPHESVSDYVLPQDYFEFSEPYVFSSLTVSASFSFTAEAIYRRTIEEYTWDDFAESAIIDRTWDEWFGDRWDSGGVAFSFGIILNANGGKLQQGTATFEAFNTKLVVGSAQFDGSASVTSSFTVSATPTRIRNAESSVTSAFTQSTQGNYTAGSVIAPAVAFTGTFIGNATFAGATVSAPLAFTQTTQGNATFVGSSTQSTAFAQTTQGNAIFGQTLELTAFYSKLSEGRIIPIPDPFNTVKVQRENRVIVLPEDSRVLKVLQETRLNTIATETRDLKVKQETRNYKISRPGFTNRSSIPRVRSEA